MGNTLQQAAFNEDKLLPDHPASISSVLMGNSSDLFDSSHMQNKWLFFLNLYASLQPLADFRAASGFDATLPSICAGLLANGCFLKQPSNAMLEPPELLHTTSTPGTIYSSMTYLTCAAGARFLWQSGRRSAPASEVRAFLRKQVRSPSLKTPRLKRLERGVVFRTGRWRWSLQGGREGPPRALGSWGPCACMPTCLWARDSHLTLPLLRSDTLNCLFIQSHDNLPIQKRWNYREYQIWIT